MEFKRPASHSLTRASLSDEIVHRILHLISRDVLKPGERLPSERDLCKRFDVGRTSLREALRSLSAMGILESRVGEGTFVCHSNKKYLENILHWGLLLDRKTVHDLLETRLMLESQTAVLAAQRGTELDFRELELTLQSMASALNHPEKFLEHDLRFHLTIARATQNPILYSLLSTIRGYLQEWIKKSLDEASTSPQTRAGLSLEEHRAILDALRERAPDKAGNAMTVHILSSSRDLEPQK